MTSQPALGDPFFEMEDAARWFNRHYTRVEPTDLMSLVPLDPPPGYAQVQEERARRHGGKSRYWEIPQWHHFRIYRDGGPPTLAVVLGTQPRVLMPRGEQDWRVPNVSKVLTVNEVLYSMWAMPPLVTWRVWLYEHRQGQGWVCLDPADDSHEVVRRMRALMVLEALK